MNKILLVLIMIIALIGGGYFLLPQEQVNQFVKYLPSPFSELLSKDDINNNTRTKTTKTAVVEQDKVFKEPETKVENTPTKKPVVEQAVIEKLVENSDTVERSEQPVVAEIIEGDSAEVIKVKKKIQKVLKKMNQFEGNSDALKARFDKIIKENRDITRELKTINDQIKEAQ